MLHIWHKCNGMADLPIGMEGVLHQWVGGLHQGEEHYPGEVHEGVGVISDGVDTVGGHRTWRR